MRIVFVACLFLSGCSRLIPDWFTEKIPDNYIVEFSGGSVHLINSFGRDHMSNRKRPRKPRY